jgi:RNA polymerase sigma-70 factor (ECF subfamily)
MLAPTTRPSKKLAPTTAELRRSLAELTPELFGRAIRMARSPQVAEDLVQDTIVRAIRFEKTYLPGTNLRAWVYQILFSVFMTRCRRSRRERIALDVLAVDPCAWTLPEPLRIERYQLSPPVARALEALPETFRDAVVLVVIEELAYKEAARRLGVPVGTVMSRLHRGRKMLAETMLAGEGGEMLELPQAA